VRGAGQPVSRGTFEDGEIGGENLMKSVCSFDFKEKSPRTQNSIRNSLKLSSKSIFIHCHLEKVEKT
jgi:hypothetical protein